MSDGRDLPAHLWPVPGLAVWLVLTSLGAAGLIELSLIDTLLAFGVAFVGPLHLGRLRLEGEGVPGALPVLVAACLGAASFSRPSGALAAAAAAPWLVLSVWVALPAVFGLLTGARLDLDRLLNCAGLVYLVVAAFWLVISRLGLRPLGLSGAIVELTAVHFTYAGFAATLVAAAVAGVLDPVSAGLGRAARLVGVGIVAAMPVVAVGFFAPQWVAAVGSVLLAVSLCGLALLLIPTGKLLGGGRRVLLVVAALPIAGTMALALLYAGGPFFRLNPPGIPTMVRWHGVGNAFLFTACSALAFVPLPVRQRTASR